MATPTDLTLTIGADVCADGYGVGLAEQNIVLPPGPFRTLVELARARLLNPGGIATPAAFGLTDRDMDALYQRVRRVRSELNAAVRGLGDELILNRHRSGTYLLVIDPSQIEVQPEIAALCPPLLPWVVDDLLRYVKRCASRESA